MSLKNRKIAYVNLSTGEVKRDTISMEWRRKFLGGRGLDAYLLYTLNPPGIDALSPENRLIISAGALGGMLASGSGRTHIMAKSPLTNYLGSANSGEAFAPEMRWAGFDHLVITGKADKPVYLWIHNGEIEIRDAKNIWGQSVYETPSILRQELNDNEIQVLCIGQAGEKLVRFANVMTGRKASGGRTGMGAVMGSKNLKAVACRGTMDLKIEYPQEAINYNFKLINQVISSKVNQTMQRWGTGFMYSPNNATGHLRTRNFQTNQLFGATNLEIENLEEHSFGFVGCFGCQVHCRHRYTIPKGRYAGSYAQGPEYTSQGAFGNEVGCDSMNLLLTAHHLADYYGIDTLETGSLIAWSMELYEKGMLTDKQTDGLKLEWGDENVVIDMIEKIARREGLGDILAEGGLRAAKKIGKGSEKYLIHVKGMSNLHSDERSTPSLALGVATASRGSDHLRSRPAVDLFNLPLHVLEKLYRQPDGYDGPLTTGFAKYEGKARMVQWQEMCYMAVDCIGMCKYHTAFLSPNHPQFPEFSEMLYYNTGMKLTPKEIWDIANRCYTIERLFNIREGLARKDDYLVDRYYEEPTKDGLRETYNKKIDREKFEGMLDEYYSLHKWDKDGVPTPELLKDLEIGNLVPEKTLRKEEGK